MKKKLKKELGHEVTRLVALATSSTSHKPLVCTWRFKW